MLSISMTDTTETAQKEESYDSMLDEDFNKSLMLMHVTKRSEESVKLRPSER